MMGHTDLVLIVGGGHFGKIAFREARGRGLRVLVIDPDPKCDVRGMVGSVVDKVKDVKTSALLVQEWEHVLHETLLLRPRFVVPACPGHLAGRIAANLIYKAGGRIEHPLMIPGELAPFTVTRDDQHGILVTTFMVDGTCKEDCHQPRICPVTGEKRSVPMHELVKDHLAKVVDHFDVLVTKDLGGAGGIPTDDLMKMMERVGSLRPGEAYGIATSCRCHAVISIFRLCLPGPSPPPH
jgi:hypothetical protein